MAMNSSHLAVRARHVNKSRVRVLTVRLFSRWIGFFHSDNFTVSKMSGRYRETYIYATGYLLAAAVLVFGKYCGFSVNHLL
jgi:hypothetical protein